MSHNLDIILLKLFALWDLDIERRRSKIHPKLTNNILLSNYKNYSKRQRSKSRLRAKWLNSCQGIQNVEAIGWFEISLWRYILSTMRMTLIPMRIQWVRGACKSKKRASHLLRELQGRNQLTICQRGRPILNLKNLRTISI